MFDPMIACYVLSSLIFQVHCMATNGADHADMILTVKVLP